MIRTFGDVIKNGTITMHMAKDKQKQLAKSIRELTSKTKPSNRNIRLEKNMIISAASLLKADKCCLKRLHVEYFHYLQVIILHNQKNTNNQNN